MTAYRRLIFSLCLLVGSVFLAQGTAQAESPFLALQPLNIALNPSESVISHVVSGYVFSQIDVNAVHSAHFELTDSNGADIWKISLPWADDFSTAAGVRLPFEFDFSEYRLEGKYRFKAYLMGDRALPLAMGRRVVNFPWSSDVEGSLSEISNLRVRNAEQMRVRFSFLNRGETGEFQGEVRVFEDSPNRPQVMFERTTSVEVGASNESDFELRFSQPKVPQLYVVEVSVAKVLGDVVTGVLSQAFLVDGKFAEAQNVEVAPQRYYREGDLVSVEFGGYARNISGSVLATISLFDEQLQEVFKSQQELPLLDAHGHIHGKMTFPIDVSTAKLSGNVELSFEGEKLGETTFETASFPRWTTKNGDSPVRVQLGRATDRLAGIWKTNKRVIVLGAAGVLLLFILVVVFAAMARRKKVKHLILLLASGLLFGHVSANDFVNYFPEGVPEGQEDAIIYKASPPYDEQYSVSDTGTAAGFNVMEFMIAGLWSGMEGASMFESKPDIFVDFGQGWESVPSGDIWLENIGGIEKALVTFSTEIPTEVSDGWVTPKVKLFGSGLASWVTAAGYNSFEFDWRPVLIDNTVPTFTQKNADWEIWRNESYDVELNCSDEGGVGCVAGENTPIKIEISENYGDVTYWMCDKVANCTNIEVGLTHTDTQNPTIQDFKFFDAEDDVSDRRIGEEVGESMTRALVQYLLQFDVEDAGDGLGNVEKACLDDDGILYWDDTTEACMLKTPRCVADVAGGDFSRGTKNLPDDLTCTVEPPAFSCSNEDFPFCFNLILPGAECEGDGDCPNACENDKKRVGTCEASGCEYNFTNCSYGCAGDECCVPDCSGKECGELDASCSTPCEAPCPDKCEGGVAFSEGTCEPTGCSYTEEMCTAGCVGDVCCEPDCSGKDCGSDGCGGFCGLTGTCEVDENCVTGVCVADCLAGIPTSTHCELPAAAHGATVAGACETPYVGACSYICTDGTWTEDDDTCAEITCSTDDECPAVGECELKNCENPGTAASNCDTPLFKPVNTVCGTDDWCNATGDCVVCNEDAQCDDGDAGTIDSCENPGLLSASCENCSDTCDSLGHGCGTPDVCGVATDCGTCAVVDCSNLNTTCTTYSNLPQVCNDTGTPFVCEVDSMYSSGCGNYLDFTQPAAGLVSVEEPGRFCDGMGATALCGIDDNCEAGETCEKPEAEDSSTWSCVAGCTDECVLGQTRCANGDVENCATDYDGDACTEWGVQITCSGGEVCADNSGTDECCVATFENACTDATICTTGTVACDGTCDTSAGTFQCSGGTPYCDGAGACVECAADAQCDDSESCTTDSCESGKCFNVATIPAQTADCNSETPYGQSTAGDYSYFHGELYKTDSCGNLVVEQDCSQGCMHSTAVPNYDKKCMKVDWVCSGEISCCNIELDDGSTGVCLGDTSLCSDMGLTEPTCVECTENSDCDDSVACTTDTCSGGVCSNVATVPAQDPACDTSDPDSTVDATTMLYYGDLYKTDSCGDLVVEEDCVTGCLKSTDPVKDEICVNFYWGATSYCQDGTTPKTYCCKAVTKHTDICIADSVCVNIIGAKPETDPTKICSECSGAVFQTGSNDWTAWECEQVVTRKAGRIRYRTCSIEDCCDGEPSSETIVCSEETFCVDGACLAPSGCSVPEDCTVTAPTSVCRYPVATCDSNVCGFVYVNASSSTPCTLHGASGVCDGLGECDTSQPPLW